METPDLSTARWRKSTYSGGNNGACVELASFGAIRDSKNPSGAALRVQLRNFMAVVQTGCFDLNRQPKRRPQRVRN
jgi:hypothetical protein